MSIIYAHGGHNFISEKLHINIVYVHLSLDRLVFHLHIHFEVYDSDFMLNIL